MTNTNSLEDSAATSTALESLRTFAVAAGEIQYAHLVTAAIRGEEWAILRVQHALAASDETRLDVIRCTDTTRTDGAVARSFSF